MSKPTEGIAKVTEQEALEALAKIKQFCHETDSCINDGCVFVDKAGQCLFFERTNTPNGWNVKQVTVYKLEEDED